MRKEYICYWCGSQFEREVEYTQGDSKDNRGMPMPSKHKGTCSTQVQCPNCLNFIRTWRREETDNVVGRQHIHFRR